MSVTVPAGVTQKIGPNLLFIYLYSRDENVQHVNAIDRIIYEHHSPSDILIVT